MTETKPTLVEKIEAAIDPLWDGDDPVQMTLAARAALAVVMAELRHASDEMIEAGIGVELAGATGRSDVREIYGAMLSAFSQSHLGPHTLAEGDGG